MPQAEEEFIAAGSAVAVIEGMRQISPDVLIACPATCGTAIEGIFSQSPSAGLVRRYTATDSPEAAVAEGAVAAGEGRRVMMVTTRGSAAVALGRLAARRHLPAVIAALDCEPTAPGTLPCGPGADPDSLCVQLHPETPQEAYDTLIQAIRIAEHPDLLAPAVVVARNGAAMPIVYNGSAAVQAFTSKPPPAPRPAPHAEAALALALVHAFGDEYGHRFGRRYAILNSEGMAGATLAVVATDIAAAAIRPALRRLRSGGTPVGLVSLRVVCPFPARELAEALHRVRAVAVFDGAPASGSAEAGSYLYRETAAALHAYQGRQALSVYLYGSEGQGLADGDIRRAVAALQEAASHT